VPRVVGADRADEGTRPEPLAAQDRVAGGRCGHHDVLGRRLAVAFARLGLDLLAERAETLLVPAVSDDRLDRRQRLSNARDLAPRLPAAADHPERRRGVPREVLRRDTACCARAQLAELVRLDHGRELRFLGVEEDDHEGRAALEPRVRLQSGEPELTVDGRHHGEGSALEAHPFPRNVVDLSGGQAPKGALDSLDRIGRREQLCDLCFGEVERH
jgi:hypothetical protein